MSDERLANILGLLDTHQAIRGHMKVVMDHVNAYETTLGLDKLPVCVTPEKCVLLNQTQRSLEQTLAYLEEGLEKQLEHENKVLPAMICDLLMQAINHDHDKVMEPVRLARSIVNIDVEHLQPDLIP